MQLSGPMQQCRLGVNCRSRVQLRTQALFGGRSKAATETQSSSGSTKKQQSTSSSNSTKPNKTTEGSFISQTLNAVDFAQVRSKKDAELLYEAKYGKRGEDGKMSREQYSALRRKIGGTARDYWKDWVEEEQVKNIKTYYKPGESAAVPYLPFLVGVVVAMLGVTVLVVLQTST
eukprot:jgi/Chrzof1/4359/Cz14g10080.t1